MRLFVAIPVEQALKDSMLQLQQRIDSGNERVRWSSAQQIHLTLKFIGQVNDQLIDPICEAVRRVGSQTAPFELVIDGTGCFPPYGGVRVIWLGSQEPSTLLRQAVQQLEEELALLGIPVEKRTFSEHFTIGRVKSDRSRGKLRESVLQSTFERNHLKVTEWVVYQSTLSTDGAVYSPITRVRLDG